MSQPPEPPDISNVVDLKSKRRRRKPASGIPAAGPGWGGDAKGPGNRGPGPGRPTRAQAAARLPHDAEIAEEARRTLLGILRDGEFETNRLNAASKLLDRIEGLPVARHIVDPDGEVDQPLTLNAVRPPPQKESA